MKTTAFGLTDRGRTREQNEDSFLLDAEAGLYVVCDGLGGHAAGETASRTAVEVASRYVADHASLIEEAGAAEGGRFAVQVLLDEAVKEASRRLHELACTHPEYAGMATTMTLVLFWEGHCTVAHAGDCRLYLLRDGEILRLTADHTMAAELVLRGELEPHEAAASGLANALTRALGSQSSVLVDTLSLDVLEDDTFLLCTDGLHRYFDDAALVEHLAARDLAPVPGLLVGLANERGGEDNLTAIAVRVAADAGPGGDEAARARRRLDALAAAPLLRDLSLRRRACVLAAMEVRHLARGERLREGGGPPAGLFVLVRGELEGLGSAPGASWGEGSLTRELPPAAGPRAGRGELAK